MYVAQGCVDEVRQRCDVSRCRYECGQRRGGAGRWTGGERGGRGRRARGGRRRAHVAALVIGTRRRTAPPRWGKEGQRMERNSVVPLLLGLEEQHASPAARWRREQAPRVVCAMHRRQCPAVRPTIPMEGGTGTAACSRGVINLIRYTACCSACAPAAQRLGTKESARRSCHSLGPSMITSRLTTFLGLHTPRILLSSPFSSMARPTALPATGRHTPTRTVLVLGASYAGHRAVQQLVSLLPRTWRVVVLERNTHFNRAYSHDLHALPACS